MTMPSGGFPPQGPPQQPQAAQQPGTQYLPPAGQQGPPAKGGSTPPLVLILALVVAALGLGSYFVSFSETVSPASYSILFLLSGGLLAALYPLPSAPKTLPIATVLCVLGFLITLSAVIEAPSVAGALVVLLIMAIVQSATAVVALLFDYEVLTLPAPEAHPGHAQQGTYGAAAGQPAYGQQPPYAQPGPFGGGQQQPPYGYPAPSAPFPQQSQHAQPSQYGAPSVGQQEQQAAPQPTHYAPHQGQFHQQQPDMGQGQAPQAGEQEGSHHTSP